MKTKIIYTILFAACTLFCQAFGAQNGWPTFYDTICAKPGDTVHMSDFKSQILELLQNREDSIWSECCDVTVGLGDISGSVIENNRPRAFNDLSGERIDIEKTIQVNVEYTRKLVCSKIPSEKETDMPPASLAMWHFFGKLLSVIDTARAITKVSDEATVTTLHKVMFVFDFKLAFPDDILFEIINEDADDFCFDDKEIWLRVPDEYSLCRLKWEVPYGIDFKKSNDTQQAVILKCVTDDYAYPIVCRAISCSGDTVADTKIIGKPTPKPAMEDVNCIASSENSFVAKVKEADNRLAYHWIFEEADGNRATQFEQGDLVTFKISPTASGLLRLYSTGGCKGSDTVTQILHRSVVLGNIQLQGDTNCVFIGDTLRFVLQNAPQDSLVWKSETDMTTLLGNAEFICNTTGLNTTSFKVSVSNKNCPESVDSNTFNIRKDLEVSIEPNESCISAHTDYVFKVSGNGINPEVHWYGNGVEIDSTTYSTKDSILLRLTNPDGQNPYVKVMATECSKFSKDSIALRPKPEMPSLDTLWNALTTCIPLGIEDTIELRIQPQEGVKFNWDFSDNEKFQRIAKSDSHSIQVRVNYDLSDRNTSLPVSVYAYTEGCFDTLVRPETLYATGAGLDEEWHIDSKVPNSLRRIVGFCQSYSDEIQTSRVELDSFSFRWTSSVKFQGLDTLQILQFVKPTLPFNVTCLLTNKNTSCYSYYSASIEEEVATLQNIVSSIDKNNNFGGAGGASNVVYMNAQPNDNLIDDIGVVLAPNPTQGNTLLYLGNTNIEEHTVIEIFTEQGVCLYRQIALANMEELPTARFRSGLYFVRVRTGKEELVVKKLIVK